jgi:hypothetical protein
MLCAHCDLEFAPRNIRRRFCSSRCRSAAWQEARDKEIRGVLDDLARVTRRVETLRRKG